MFLQLGQCELGGREFQNQGEQKADDNTGSCYCHPETASAEKFAGHKQEIQNTTGDQETENCGYDLHADHADTGKNHICKENAASTQRVAVIADSIFL